MATPQEIGAWMANNDAAILQHMGIEFVSIDAGTATMQLTVQPEMLNSGDVCQGGFVFTLADHAFAFACLSDNQTGLTLSADIVYTSPARLDDVLTATATVLTAKGRTVTCDVTVVNQREEPIALFRGVWYRTKSTVIVD